MEIVKRSEVPEEYTWDLSHLFPAESDWQKELEALGKIPEHYRKLQGRLGESAEMLLEFFRLEDDTAVRLSALYSYAGCHNDEDTSNSHYVDLKSKATRVYVELSAASAFAAPEIQNIPEDTLEAFLKRLPALKEYARSLEKIRRMCPHTLSPESERLLAAAGEMAQSSSEISAVLRNADLRFPDVRDGEGKKRKLTSGTLVPYLESSDRSFRRRIFKAYYKVLGQFSHTLAGALDGQFRQLRFFAEARQFSSTLEASLFEHEVPVEVYQNLIRTVHGNFGPMYRYVALRKRMLGVPKLHMYDVYTPIVGDLNVTVPYDQAKSTVSEALAVLGEDYTAMLREGFDHRWIDVYENEGKRDGAYSTDVSRPHPYVLMNYKDNLDSVFTLAHEMGHSLHSCLSTKNQPVSTSEYVIFVAEVASTVNELLLMRYLLEKTEDTGQRAYLINHFLDQFKGTLYRQTMFAEFELAMGEMSENGEALTSDALCKKYLELNRLYFGPDMVSDEEIGLEWARIPHFFYNYYVFQYATSFAAAVAITKRIAEEGRPAVDAYKKFLSGGCSSDPISLLKTAGVDMSTPEPVQSALQYFETLVEEMEKLTLS